MLLVPVAVLVIGPRLWVRQVLKQHNRREDPSFPSGGELAKELLDRHNLQRVRVESSDIGDHYDPKAKAVRLTRDKIERKTLTAMTTAAHEVAHALQDASNYPPFVWRMRLVTLAQTTGQIGSVILIAVPAVALFTRQMVPPVLVGAAAFAMIGTGIAAQLVALPTELDASFGRAMPLLRAGYITEKQAKDARKILVASSLTYVASSLLSVLNIWPWLGWWGPPIRLAAQNRGRLTLADKTYILGARTCAVTL
jgi:Zn-dependent membrane protease YugP